MNKAEEVLNLLKDEIEEKLDKKKIVSEVQDMLKEANPKQKEEVMKVLKKYKLDSKDLSKSVEGLSDKEAEKLMSELLSLEIE